MKPLLVIGSIFLLFAVLGPLMPLLILLAWAIFFGRMWISDVAGRQA